jgi:hypothetical protein
MPSTAWYPMVPNARIIRNANNANVSLEYLMGYPHRFSRNKKVALRKETDYLFESASFSLPSSANFIQD